MSVPAHVMASDPNTGIIRHVIELRVAYEKLSGVAPTHLYAGNLVTEILRGRGFKEGMQVAGLKLVPCPQLPESEAICSASARLFVVHKARGTAKA